MRPFRTIVFLVLTVLSCFAQARPPQAKIVQLFQSAQEAQQAGKFRTALGFYDSILKLAPEMAEVWTNRGLVLEQLGNHRQALSSFQRATKLKPSLSVPWLFTGVELLALNQPAAAIEPLQTVLELDPGSLEAHGRLAAAYAALGHYKDAVPHYRNIVEANGADELLWYQMGTAYLEWSKQIGAEIVSRDSPYSLLLLAELEAVGGFKEPAESKYHDAVSKLSPEEVAELPISPATFLTAAPAMWADVNDKIETNTQIPANPIVAGEAAWRDGLYNHALYYFSAALQNERSDRTLYWMLLTCRALSSESLRRVVGDSPDSWRAHLLLAEIARDRRDDQQALSEYEMAVKNAPRNAGVRLAYIQFLRISDRSDETLEKAHEAVKAFPKDARLNCELANALLKSGDAKSSIPLFQVALKGEPDLSPAHAGLAEAYATTGTLDLAVSEMEQALPSDIDGSLHYRIAHWYQQMGRQKDAQAAFAETARLKEERIREDRAKLLKTRPQL